MTDVPHFAFPFTFGSFNEQDGIEDITACVTAIVTCPLGHRVEEPQFGIGDQTFSQGGADLSIIRAAVARWENRADADIDQTIAEALTTVQVSVKERQ
jgi:phage baseplate assembly protein W